MLNGFKVISEVPEEFQIGISGYSKLTCWWYGYKCVLSCRFPFKVVSTCLFITLFKVAIYQVAFALTKAK